MPPFVLHLYTKANEKADEDTNAFFGLAEKPANEGHFQITVQSSDSEDGYGKYAIAVFKTTEAH
jgi:hypothetical protein